MSRGLGRASQAPPLLLLYSHSFDPTPLLKLLKSRGFVVSPLRLTAARPTTTEEHTSIATQFELAYGKAHRGKINVGCVGTSTSSLPLLLSS